jgi:O-acetyl-ADP-ribose deacetylase (regulator of RNase III)
MLNKVKGNLLDMADNGEFDIIIHGCNCFNTMGAGIARQIADRYPSAQEADNKTRRGDFMKLGNFTWGRGDGFDILNAYTQYGTAGDGEDVFEYDAFKLVLRKVLHEFGACRYGLPYIGMGLAGGDKKRILAIMDEFAKEVTQMEGTVTLVEFG